MAQLTINLDTICPACGQDAKLPDDFEGGDLHTCSACGQRVEVATRFESDDTVLKVWLQMARGVKA